MDAADDGKQRPEPACCCYPYGPGNGCKFWLTHTLHVRPPENNGRRKAFLQPRSTQPEARQEKKVAVTGKRYGYRRNQDGCGPVCFPGCGWWFIAFAFKIRYTRRKGLWRLPGKWAVAAMCK